MKKQVLILLLAVFCASCTKERISGSGKQVSETRTLPAFTSVTSSGSNRVHINYGQAFEVQLRGSDNLIPHFKTDVKGEELHLGFEDFQVSDDDIEVFVTLPAIRGVGMSGSGQVSVSGAFPLQESIDFRSSGSGHLEVSDPMQASSVSIAVSGSGKTDVQKLRSKTADVRISGSGDVMVAPQETLKVSISGSGTVYYTGNPVIDSSISGSGKIIHR
jgi:hypothetical protein